MSAVEILYESPELVAGCTNRGSVDDRRSPYAGFNVCGYTGDTPEHVDDCVKYMSKIFGIKPEHIIIPRQVHGTEVAVVESVPADAARLEGIDAVVTTVRGLMVGVSTADCIPVLLFDEQAGIVAAAHAGWRGAVAGVVERTVDTMRSLGAADIKGIIGTGICCRCFEVGPEVSERFPVEFVSDTYGSKPHVDLPGYIASVIEKCNVDIIGRHSSCTRCMPQRYFSARALGIKSGRNYTFVMLH